MHHAAALAIAGLPCAMSRASMRRPMIPGQVVSWIEGFEEMANGEN
jgi:hypothetical protein